MADKFCGKGGSDSNNGLSWATRKLTIVALVNILAAGDTGYVGPGTFREHVDLGSAVDGSSGSRIRLIADITGEHTDGVGGTVRITGSDNDTTVTRSYGFTITNRQYWDIENFTVDSCSSYAVYGYQSAHMRIRRLFVQGVSVGMFFEDTLNDLLLDGCVFWGAMYRAVEGQSGGTDYGSSVIQNCIVMGGYSSGEAFRLQRGGITVNNNYIQGYAAGVFTSSAGSTITAVNNIVTGSQYGMRDDTGANRISQSNNCLYNNEGADFSGVTGTVAYPYRPLHAPWLNTGSGYLAREYWPFQLLPESPLVNVGGSSPPSNDNTGAPRPLGLAACIGPVEYRGTWSRQTAHVRSGMTYGGQLTSRDYRDFEIDVTAGQAVNASIYTMWDNDATMGVKPSIELLGCGLDASPVVATGDGTAWTQISITDTPTVSGRARVRVKNNCTDTTSRTAYFGEYRCTT